MQRDLDGRRVQARSLGVHRRIRKRVRAREPDGADEGGQFTAIGLGVDRLLHLPIFGGFLRLQFFRALGDLHVIDIVGLELQNFFVAQIGYGFCERLRPVTRRQENIVTVGELRVVVRLFRILRPEENFQRFSALQLRRHFDRRFLESKRREVLRVLRDRILTFNARNIGSHLLPFIRIRLDARRGSDFPLLITFLDTGDRLIRINQADLVDVVLVNLKCFLFCFFLLLPCFFPAKFGEVNVGAENDKKREENRCAFESHFLRFIQTEMPATRTPAGSSSSMTYETSRPCDSVMVRRRSSGLFGRMEMKFSS